jgi:hypothetical protein
LLDGGLNVGESSGHLVALGLFFRSLDLLVAPFLLGECMQRGSMSQGRWFTRSISLGKQAGLAIDSPLPPSIAIELVSLDNLDVVPRPKLDLVVVFRDKVMLGPYVGHFPHRNRARG